jgi:hypothetical protein
MSNSVEIIKGYGPLSSVHYLKEGYAVGSQIPADSPWLTVYSSHYQGSRVVFPTAEDAEVRAAWMRERVINLSEVQVRRVNRLDCYRILD